MGKPGVVQQGGILAKNKDGLTALQITNQVGDRMRGSVLYLLQKEGKKSQKKANPAGGRIGLVDFLKNSTQSPG